MEYKRVSFTLPLNIANELKSASEKTGIPQSRIVSRAFREWNVKHDQTQKKAT